MITLVIPKTYIYSEKHMIEKPRAVRYIEMLEKPLRKLVGSFWIVLTSPVEKT